MKSLYLAVLLSIFTLTGCHVMQGAHDEAEQKKTDTSKMIPVEAFQVNAGHMLAALGIIVAGTLTHGLVNASTVKDLVTSLDTSVPASVHSEAITSLGVSVPMDVHAQSLQGLAQSVPVTTP